MNRVKAANSVAFANRDIAPVSGTAQYFTAGNPVGPVPATTLPGYYLNMVQDELLAVITAAGLTPDDTNWGQLLTAIERLSLGRNRAIYTLIAGVQNVSINGAAPTTVGAGTFTWPASGAAKVTLLGAGAGASGCNGTTVFAGANGSGGGWSIKWLAGQTPGSTIAVTVGAGGAGSAAGVASGAGGTTSFGAACSATGGGSSGGAGLIGGGSPGTGASGDLNGSGNCGSDGSTNAAASGGWAGLSGSSLLGGASRSGSGSSSVGGAPGAGGSAPYGNSAFNGSAGASGIVIVEY